jgi:hypothetical protein
VHLAAQRRSGLRSFPSGSQGASIFYSVGGGRQLFGGANCQAVVVDGQLPASAAEAQLLDMVCKVAYGAPA